MAFNFNDENNPWEFSLDIDDSDLHLTPVLRSSSSTRVEPSILTPSPFRIVPYPAGIAQLSSSTRVEPSSSTSNPIRIIPGLAGIVQQAKMLKEQVFILDSDGALMSTQEYMQKFVEDGVRMVILRVVKENQEKDKIGSKPDKNGKRGIPMQVAKLQDSRTNQEVLVKSALVGHERHHEGFKESLGQNLEAKGLGSLKWTLSHEF
nr:hypothetical protein [Tanacetum cinerariifolium]